MSEFTSVVRVLVADRAPLFGAGVTHSLATVADVDVIASLGSDVELAAILPDSAIDIILLDSGLPGGCTRVCELVSEVSPTTRVIVMVQEEDDTELAGAVRAGARGYVRKDLTAEELVAFWRNSPRQLVDQRACTRGQVRYLDVSWTYCVTLRRG